MDNLDNKILVDPSRIVVFRTNTTGKNTDEDEILHFSVIDGNGVVSLNTHVKPTRHESWQKAMEKHGITPDDVADAPTIMDLKQDIEKILNNAELYVGYNVDFDIKMLISNGIEIKDKAIYDVMLKFAPIYGKFDPFINDYKHQKLEICAYYYDYEFKAFDNLENTKAILHCFKRMNKGNYYIEESDDKNNLNKVDSIKKHLKNGLAFKEGYYYGRFKSRSISLNGNTKLINACKKAGLEIYKPRGNFNGHGYNNLPIHVQINSADEMFIFNNIKTKIRTSPLTPEKEISENKNVQNWARRLARLTDISFEEALNIACNRINYKEKQIRELEERQYFRGYSNARELLIDEIESINPLASIKNEDGALAILNAYYRHNNSNYDQQLDNAKTLAYFGMIDKDLVKEYAITHTTYDNEITIEDDEDEINENNNNLFE